MRWKSTSSPSNGCGAFQHPSGAREIDELHVPSDTPVRLAMTSEDVIHDLYLPALRLKQDILPDRYTYLWFTANKTGIFHLTCAEYCGTDHSVMAGQLGDRRRRRITRDGRRRSRKATISRIRARPCSARSDAPAATRLDRPCTRRICTAIYGQLVQLSDGRTVTADEAYLRDSILLPDKDIVAGFPPIMPSFTGVASEDQIVELLAYLKSLSTRQVDGARGAHAMTDTTLPFVPPLEERRAKAISTKATLCLSWLATTDHKRIAILYALSITVFFFIGGAAIASGAARTDQPDRLFLTSDEYNRLFTHARHHHGVVLSGAVNPGHHGKLPAAADDRRARRRLSAPESLFLVSLRGRRGIHRLCADCRRRRYRLDVLSAVLVELFALQRRRRRAGVFVVGFSSIATGVNFLTTIHMLRAPGMTWFRLPLFVWSMYAVSLVMVLATPVLAMSLLLITAERLFGLPIFDAAAGGDPILFQHLFWFYSHPAVYIMILPAMGVVSEVFACFSRSRVFGYAFMVYSLLSIAVVGFMVWGHHMFVAGQSPFANLVFSFLSFIVAVPSAIKVFNWTCHAVSRPHRIRGADGLCARLPRPVHHRGPDRTVSRFGADRYRDHRHLFRRRAFPHHHGWRHRVGFHGRHPLLVAEGDRPARTTNSGRSSPPSPCSSASTSLSCRSSSWAGKACRAAITTTPMSFRSVTSLERRRGDSRRRLSHAVHLSQPGP